MKGILKVLKYAVYGILILLAIIIIMPSPKSDNKEVEAPQKEESQDEGQKWSKEVCEANAQEHPAGPGVSLVTKGDNNFTGVPYYFKGTLLTQGEAEAFDGHTVWLVKNDKGYVMPIEMPDGERATEGDTIEVWGTLSGDGYSMPNVENVVGETGYLLTTQYSVNGEQKI